MPKIYIGVGHGGADPGAVSGKHREASYALDIATACTEELRRYGVQVMQSRTTDTTESAKAKIAECNAYAPDFALDIHLNAGGGNGFEVFHSVAGGKGKALAQSIEKAVVAAGQNSRGVKTRTNSAGKDYFGFVRQTSCPALLVECAFIDSADVQIADTPAERKTFGKAIARGILNYLDIETKSETPSGESAKPAPESKTETTPVNVVVSLPLLSRGVNAPDYQVKRVQMCLSQMGYKGADGKVLTIDGDYGKNTEYAVMALQKAHGITPDGRMSAKTWRALLVFAR